MRQADLRSAGGFPEIVEIELTRRCNLACRMCQRQVVRSLEPRRELRPLVLEEVLDQCGAHRPQINLGGLGESLLHRGLPDLLRRIKRRQVSFPTGFNTNGQLLDESCWDWMLDGRLDHLSISLDAPTKEGYRWLIGSDRYERVVDNARRFLERKGRGRRPLTTVHSFDLPAFAEDNIAFSRRWGELADFAQIRSLGNWGGVLATDAFGVHVRTSGVCDRPWVSLALDLDGGYHRCCASFQLVAPKQTIFDLPIADYWRGLAMATLRREMTTGRFEGRSICAGCSGRDVPPNTVLEQAGYRGLDFRTPESGIPDSRAPDSRAPDSRAPDSRVQVPA